MGTHAFHIYKDQGSFHMRFARSVQFALKNGQVDEFKRLMNTEILPLLKQEKGFRQTVTVLERNAGMSITVWDDRPSAESYNTKTYPEVLKKLSAVLEGTPSVHMYDTVFTLVPEVVLA